MEVHSLRKCLSIKSKKHPNVQCPLHATQGDFCSRHFKNPIRFQKTLIADRAYTRRQTQAALRLQIFWRRWSALRRYHCQGPASNDLSLSSNETEVYSLDVLATIPKMFLFSFADSHKNIWTFDIRSLSHMVSESDIPVNPYTRDSILSGTLQKIHKRLLWLRKRSYPILYSVGENLTQEQIWNSKVLDVFFKMESLGYRASCRWFELMSVVDHEDFYRSLHRLWTFRLGLTSMQKEEIIPGHSSGTTKVFKNTPEKLQGGAHDLKWWRRNNLNLILSFLTSSSQKTNQSLGALYVLMAIVNVVPEAAEAYPWILETQV